MTSYSSRISTVTVLLALLVAMFGGAERAASADLPGGRSAPLAASPLHVCKSGCDYSTVSAAVDDAHTGDTIKVAKGTYSETVVVYNTSLTILGGYCTSNWEAQDPESCETIIDANTAAATVKLAGPNGGPYTGMLDGFTVTGGNNTSGQGGGVFVSEYRATISNCRIHGNRAKYGGGISVGNATNVVIQDNEIYGNTSTVDGGGIRVQESSVSIVGNTIRSNNANYGGGISVRKSTATIDDNTIRLNVAESGGAGMQFILGSEGVISNNRLLDNQAGPNPGGGGIHFYQCSPQYGGTPQFVGNTVTGNTASNAGGGLSIEDSAPLVEDNEITENHAGDHGGGISMIVDSEPTIVGNLIADNTSSVKAGGIWSYESAPRIRSNEIVDNQAPTAGGIHLTGSVGFEVTNNIIARNKATIEGGGIHLVSNSRGNIINNTLVNNNLGAGAEAINLRNNTKGRIANNIMVGHSYGVRVREDAAPTVEYNDVWQSSARNYEGVSGGPGAISCDPEFVNLAGGDYHLTAGSCVIDKGTRTGAPTYDFDGDPRPVDGDESGNAAWDMGADEYFNPVWVTKDVNKQVLEPNEDVSFTIEYRNNAASLVSGVLISDDIDEIVDWLIDIDWYYTGTGPTPEEQGSDPYVWSVPGGLDAGEGGTITITATVDPSVSTPTAITNEVTFQMDGYGPFTDEVLIIVGGLTTHTPAVLNDFAQ